MKKLFFILAWLPQLIIGAPDLSLIKKTCESAQNTLVPLTFRGIAKAIELSNDHKTLGIVTVGLAGVGALYILTRPYAWASRRSKEAEQRALISEKDAEIQRITLEKLSAVTVYESLERECDLWRQKSEDAEAERDTLIQQVYGLAEQKRLPESPVEHQNNSSNVDALPDSSDEQDTIVYTYIATAPSDMRKKVAVKKLKRLSCPAAPSTPKIS